MSRLSRPFALLATFAVTLLGPTILVPPPASAIQLRWSDGTTDLTVSRNLQAVLVVQADSADTALPSCWRLLWTADSLGVQFEPFDPNQACSVDTAKVDSIAPPQSAADSLANLITAYFCSSGSGRATTAYYLADLPAGGRGKLKVVALDPADTTQVIESNEVTINGGVDGEYAPAILSASRSHSGSDLRVTAVGSGLANAPPVQIAARDASVGGCPSR